MQMWFMLKMKLSCHDRSNQVQPVIITRHNNDVTKHTRPVYAKNNIELSWSIGLSVIYDEN